MKFDLQTVVAILSSTQLSLADSQYRSRPDLSPPILNITIPATSDVAPGYIFVAPYNSGSSLPEQPTAYIFRDNGDLIWSSLGYFASFVANFHVTKYNGSDILAAFEGAIDLSHGHGFGHATLLDKRYERVGSVRGGRHRILDLHEFTVVNGKTALVEIYDPVPLNLAPYGGNESQKWIVDAVVQELDLETNALLFEWSSLDHISPNDSVVPLGHRANEGESSFEAWDYFHANSVDKDSEGNYLVSGRHTSSVYKLNGTTGELIWTLGGKKSNFTFAENTTFAFQHDARFRGRKSDDVEYISLFDNGAGSNGHQGGEQGEIRDYSTGKLYALNTTSWNATLITEVIHPDHVLAVSQGNTQILPNGNLFVNWGSAGTITEFRANDSKPIFNAYLDLGAVQNYRGFRLNWTGAPTEDPAIIAVKNRTTVTIYVSWNGDTETAVWRFFEITGNDKKALGEVRRTSFETSLKIAVDVELVKDALFFAEAIDRSGDVISRTEVTDLRAEVRSEYRVGSLAGDVQKVVE